MNPLRVTIVGAGVSGLSCARRLQDLAQEKSLPLDLHLLDAGDRPGGSLRTVARDGFLMEEGPDCFITEKPAGIELVRALGLEGELLRTNQDLARSFILKGKELHPIPEGFYLLAPSRLTPFLLTPLLSPWGRFRAALEPLVPRRRDPQDESVGAFVRRRLGAELLEALAQPLIGGVYNADPDELSLAACLPKFKEMERRYGSLLRGLSARKVGAQAQVSGARYSLFMSLKGGMGALAEALARGLPPGCVWTRHPLEELKPSGRATWSVTACGRTHEADAVVLALPPSRMRDLLAPLDPEWDKLLSGIPAHDSATLNLGFRRQDVGHPLDGFGFVVPSREGKLLLGCTFASRKFEGRAPEGKVLLRAFLGRAAVGLLRAQGEGAVVGKVLEELKPILGLKADPLLRHLACFPSAMSYYRPGHLSQASRLAQKARETPGLYLAGNGLNGVGIPDCVASGQAAAGDILQDLTGGRS
jgi:oxygen-dependent protoporphyrinogen oxidase